MDLKKLKNKLSDEYESVFKKLNIEYEVFGDNVYSTCPAHEGSDNPRAFSYSISRKMWKCWTKECQNHFHNDIFGIIKGALSNQTGREVTFSEVLSWITSNFNCSNCGGEETKQVEEQDCEFSLMVKCLRKKTISIKEQEVELEKYDAPSSYFVSRGFLKKTLLHFDIGDCYNKGVLCERAIIPIHNASGSKIIGATARSIKDYRLPKFLIYPSGFDKNSHLYNYHRAKEKAKQTSAVFITEGQGDVWRLYESGVENAVGVFGKTLSEKQEQKLRNLGVTRIVVLFDNDQAGREAKLKIQRHLGRMYSMIFPKFKEKDVGDMSAKQIKTDILSTLKGLY